MASSKRARARAKARKSAAGPVQPAMGAEFAVAVYGRTGAGPHDSRPRGRRDRHNATRRAIDESLRSG